MSFDGAIETMLSKIEELKAERDSLRAQLAEAEGVAKKLAEQVSGLAERNRSLQRRLAEASRYGDPRRS